MARATATPRTSAAPASRSAFAQASSVAPVVITSSTSKTRSLSTWLPGHVAKAPRTASHVSLDVRRCLSGRGRFLTKSTPWCGSLSRFASRPDNICPVEAALAPPDLEQRHRHDHVSLQPLTHFHEPRPPVGPQTSPPAAPSLQISTTRSLAPANPGTVQNSALD